MLCCLDTEKAHKKHTKNTRCLTAETVPIVIKFA